MSPSQAVSDRTLQACRRFLRSFSQAVKLTSLYKANHPVPASSLQEAWRNLQEFFSESGWPELSLGLVAGRWMANEQLVSDSAQTYELLANVFRCHALHSITFKSECRQYEFSILAELSSTPPHRAYETNAADFLKERGVLHIQVNVEEFVRTSRVRLPASPVVQSPLAALSARARRAVSGPQEKIGPGESFGTFIRSLVERCVQDPQQRARIYSEAVRHVEQTLARHVADATHQLLLEKQGVVNERMRTENALANMAQGKVVVDQEGRVLMMDPVAEQIVGRPLADVAGKPILEGLAGGEQFVSLAKDLVLPENRPLSPEMNVGGAGEALSAFRQSVAVVHDDHGRVVGTYATLPHAAKFREAQRMQDEFLANITHDLKAPLASICSALEVLSDKLGKQLGEESEFLDISLRNSQLLRSMIEELLDFSKISSGKMTVHPEPGELEPVLRECVSALTPWARSKRIRLEVKADSPPRALPRVLLDRGRVVQIFNNLLSNAIKFTPEDGVVALSAAEGEGERSGFVVAEVWDTGCGIPPAEQSRIFERFSQVQPGRREGVGLGLSIARELVSLHGGELWFDSKPGEGSVFRFSLRRAPPEGGKTR